MHWSIQFIDHLEPDPANPLPLQYLTPVQQGRDGVELEYEQTPAFHESWKVKSRDMIAQAEWRRRKLGKRVSFLHMRESLSFAILESLEGRGQSSQ